MNKLNKKNNQGKIQSLEKYLKVNSISMYLKEIEKIPLLNRDDEIDLSEKSFNGNREAKEKLIISNLRFVVSIAKKYQGFGIPLSDLISEGNIGLITAVDKFDYRRGFHFISYAIWWIKQAIMKCVSEKSRMVRLPINRTNELMHIWKFIDQYTKNYGKRPNEEIIATEMGMDKNEVKKILDFSQGHSSIEEMFMNEDGNGDENLKSSIEEQNHLSPDDMVIKSSLQEGIGNVLSRLSDRERVVIECRFGLNGEEPQSLSKIGVKLNLTKERIRQIEKYVIDFLRQDREANYLYSYLN